MEAKSYERGDSVSFTDVEHSLHGVDRGLVGRAPGYQIAQQLGRTALARAAQDISTDCQLKTALTLFQPHDILAWVFPTNQVAYCRSITGGTMMIPYPSLRSSANTATVAPSPWYIAPRLVTGAIVLTFCVLPLGSATWAQFPPIGSSAPASTSAPSSGPSSASPAGTALYRMPKEEPKATPTSPSTSHQADAIPTTVRAEAARLGSDPARMLAWVASEIGQEVYPGVMLGAAGTLIARAGNASDKALLVRELLRASDASSELRLATCTLQAEQADQIVDAALAYRPVPPTLLLEVASDVAQHTQEPNVRQLLERAGKSWQALVDEARAESDQLAKALAAAGIKLASPTLARDKLRAMASRHVWLQRRQGNEWTDFDPTLKDAVPGLSRCQAESVTPEPSPCMGCILSARRAFPGQPG
jgi:hypothetical protein